MRVLVVFLLFITVLFADRDGGPYLGFGYGVSQYDDGGFYKEAKEDNSKSATFYGGAYINKHLSVELGYVSFDAKGHAKGYKVVDSLDKTKVISFSARTISALAHYAFFSDTLDFYAKFGAGKLSHSSLRDDGSTMVYGAGVGYRFNKYLSLKIAYDNYQFGYDVDGDNASDHKMKLDFVYSAVEVQF